MVFLVAVASVLAKNLTAFLIFSRLMEGYMLIASKDAIVTSSLTNFFFFQSLFQVGGLDYGNM